MKTRPRQSISMLDALKSLSVEPGEDSNALFWALSIGSARLEAIGGRLDRIIARPSPGNSETSSETSAIGATISPAS